MSRLSRIVGAALAWACASAATGWGSAAHADAWVKRMHSTATDERVDISDARITKVRTQHNIGFDALVRAIEWARSPWMRTSSDGVLECTLLGSN